MAPFVGLLLSLFVLSDPALAEAPTFQSSKAYDQGSFGGYPVSNYLSSDHISPRVNILKSDPSCNDGSLILLGPRGWGVRTPFGPLLLDQDGHMIWTSTDYAGDIYNVDVQQYRGKPYLTFFVGDDQVKGHGSGFYYMLDETYSESYVVGAAGDLFADLHEFKITDEGTALITIYDLIRGDLSSIWGTSNGWILDCLIQEVDIETGELLFEWRASDHFDIEESYQPFWWFMLEGWFWWPYDFFHINSIEKDSLGNYLISSRNLHTVSYIDGNDGTVLWTMGGRRNDFEDLSDQTGAAIGFGWQHDARWHGNHTKMTIFDNASDGGWWWTKTSPTSTGILLEVDTTTLTVKLLQRYEYPERISSNSQGDLRILPNGNVFMAYGSGPGYSEFSPSGTLLCDVHFGPFSGFDSGEVYSYRVVKRNWTGRPDTDPPFVLYGGAAYVSWNGATEVRTWILQGSENEDGDDNEFVELNRAEKTGFETRVELNSSNKPYLRMVALDKDANILGVSNIVRARDGLFDTLSENFPTLLDEDLTSIKILLIIGSMIATVVATREGVAWWKRRRGRRIWMTTANM